MPGWRVLMTKKKSKRKQKGWKQFKDVADCVMPPFLFSALTAWLFFDFAPAGMVLLCYVPFGTAVRWKKQKEKERWQLNMAFRDALLYLQNGLAAGYSPETSMRDVVKGMEQLYGENHAIVSECRLVLSQMTTGYSMEQALQEFGERSRVDDIRQFAEVFSIAKRSGGDIGRIIRQTSALLQEKIELKRELHVTTAAKKTEFTVMSAVPHGILLYLKLCAPSMSAPLYHNASGMVFMGLVLVFYLSLRSFGLHIVETGIRA